MKYYSISTMQGVKQVYKRIGETPLETLNRNKDPTITEYAYTGRLDPMAHGYLLLLFGDETKKIKEYNQKSKKYKFQMLVGIETDTTDILGLIQTYTTSTQINVNQIVQKYNGLTYYQEYHIYSSMTAPNKDGIKVPLWKLAKDKDLPKIIPSKIVTINDFKLNQMFIINRNDLQSKIRNNLSQLTTTGQFRLDEIKSKWESFTFSDQYYVYEFDADVSSGTYIRQLVKDIGTDLGKPTMVIDLYRYPFDKI